MKPKIKHPKLDPSSHRELRALADLVGEFIGYWGFKPVQGRMWCYLFLINEPLNSLELAQLLEVSPSLITQSVQVLLDYRVIIEAPKGPNGILCFKANPNVAEAISGVLAQRELLLLQRIWNAYRDLEESPEKTLGVKALSIDRAKVQLIGQWVSLAKTLLQAGLRTLYTPNNPFEKPRKYRDLFS